MDASIQRYWQIRLQEAKQTLEANHFEVFLAETPPEACTLVLNQILPGKTVRTISWGGSLTFTAIGLYEALKQQRAFEMLDTFDTALDPAAKEKLRRQALLVDMFITGSNAVTESGWLVNLDMIGNRVGALTFGPKHVLVLAGRNKLVPDLERAMERIKGYAAPVNAMRLGKKTPCVQTARCMDCLSPDRICNTWTITEKAFPRGRISVVLINADLGY